MILLSQASALNAGHELWILPQYEESSWTPKIDWMINFQVLKNLRHVSKVSPSPLNHILMENEIKLHPVEIDTHQLLIGSSRLLPNRWLLYCPVEGGGKNSKTIARWLQEIHQVWSKLNCPSLRIFLPKNLLPSEVSLEWERLEPQYEIALVLDALVS